MVKKICKHLNRRVQSWVLSKVLFLPVQIITFEFGMATAVYYLN
jgi:hypothetical protein